MPRGRPKKSTDLTELETLPTPQIDKKTVTRVEKWTETPATPQSQLMFDEEIDPEDEAIDVFDAVFQDFGGDTSEWSIKVFRLPNYAQDGKTAVAADKKFCLDLPITVDYLTIIQQEYGPGTYLLELRQHGRVKKIKKIGIAAPVGASPLPFRSSGSQNPTTMHLTQAAGIPMEAPDPIKQFDQMIDMVSKFRRAFGVPLDQQPQVQAPPPKEEDGDESFVKSLMTIAMADDNLRSSAIKSVGGLLKGNGAVHETSVNDLILAGINVLPQIFDKAEGFLSRILSAKGVELPAAAAPAASPVQTKVHNPTSDNSLVATPPSNPAPGPGSSTEEQVVQRALQTLLITCSEYPLHLKNCEYEECAEARHMMGVANWILNYETTYPDIIGPLINDLLKLSPDQVIETIKLSPETAQYASLPHCRQWIEDLQEVLRKASEPEGDESHG